MNHTSRSSSGQTRVAVIGAGASGLVAARFLLKHGADVVVYEQHSGLGGQWDHTSPYSAVWSDMRTNTCSVTTRFSDMKHHENVPLYPRNQTILEYLNRYADVFGIVESIRFETRVLLLEQLENVWKITSVYQERVEYTDEYDAVVIASGRFRKPYVPDVEGLHAFTGKGGISHSYRYKEPDTFRGMRVLVAGGSISAYEISTSLAMEGAKLVITAGRRAKYISGRLYQGRSVEYLRHTRYARMLSELMPRKETLERTKAFLLKTMGAPEQFGAIAPDVDPEVAGFSTSETYLPMVAEGLIQPKPWISRIAGTTVYFSDGSVEREVDAIVFCTGYDLEIPFLSEALRDQLQPTRQHLPLAWYTFHPDIPTLAFLGFWFHSGSVFISTEQQARMVAYEFCGVNKATTRVTRMKDYKKYLATQHMHAKVSLYTFSHLLSELGRFSPDLSEHPDLARYLLFGPITPSTFRLSGIDAVSDAPQRIIFEAGQYGIMKEGVFSEDEKAKLRALAVLKNDSNFTRYVQKVIRRN